MDHEDTEISNNISTSLAYQAMLWDLQWIDEYLTLLHLYQVDEIVALDTQDIYYLSYHLLLSILTLIFKKHV